MRQFLIFLAICSVFISSKAQEPQWMQLQYYLESFTFHDIPSAQNVSLSQYAGLWYDYAHIPFYWESNCYCIEAYYAPQADGGISVNNTCVKDSVNGKLTFNLGSAYQAGNETSQLVVGFFNLFAAPYWILEVPEDYSYALVGSPALDYLWILSRTPTLNNATYTRLVAKAQGLGFPTNTLVFTESAGCPTNNYPELLI